MLGNVIDLNNLPVKQAVVTNHKYRAIGLGTFGWHHLLAQKNIEWETEEAVQYADELYEKIAYYTIKTSADLAKEKGSYPILKAVNGVLENILTKRVIQTSSGRN